MSSDKRLDALISSLDDMIFELDDQFRFLNVWANDSKLLFMPRESFLGKNIREVFREDYASQFIPHLQNALASGNIITHEYQSPVPGDKRLYRARITPWNNKKGIYNRLFIMVADITALSGIDRQTDLNNERYSLGLKDAEVGIWDWNIENGNEWWSPKYYRMLGYDFEEIQPSFHTFLYELLHPADREKVLSSFKNHLTRNIPSRLEVRMRTKSGEYKWFETGGERQWYENNKPVRMVGFIVDISEKKENERKLKESQQRFEQIFKYAPNGITIISLEGVWLHSNRAFCEMVGYKERELVGKKYQTITHPDDIRLNEEMVRKLLNNETDNFEIEKRYTHKQGHPVWVLLRASLVKDEEGTPLYGIIQTLDITKRKEDEKEKEQAMLKLNRQNEQLNNFAYVVSHNLRAHASNLKILATLYDDAASADEQKEYYGKIEKIIAALDISIEELGQIVRATHDTGSKRETVDFATVFNRVRNTLEADIIKSRAGIRTDFGSCPTVEYVTAYLESILQNLLTNAIKYRAADRPLEIFVETRVVDNNKTLIFRDNGLGIDLEKYGKKIFGLYKTFHGHPDARGIGLYLVKTQVESMGGAIAVFSRPGEGTAFEITF